MKMIRKYLCDTMLFWLIVRAVAEYTADYIGEKDIFVNHGLRNVTTVSVLQCFAACELEDMCESVSYNNADRICQVNDKNPDTDETAMTTSSDGWTSFYPKRQCRSDWTFYKGSCYDVVTSPKNWVDAESHCQALDGHLADIQNADEFQFLLDLANNAQVSMVWIGLNDRDAEGSFSWSSSAPMQLDFLPSVWNAGNVDCAIIELPSDLRNIFCTSRLYSICKAGE